jgi:hypothetical protein
VLERAAQHRRIISALALARRVLALVACSLRQLARTSAVARELRVSLGNEDSQLATCDSRQHGKRHFERIAESIPAVRLVCVGVTIVGNEVLTRGQHFDFVRFVLGSIARQAIGSCLDLRERLAIDGVEHQHLRGGANASGRRAKSFFRAGAHPCRQALVAHVDINPDTFATENARA